MSELKSKDFNEQYGHDLGAVFGRPADPDEDYVYDLLTASDKFYAMRDSTQGMGLILVRNKSVSNIAFRMCSKDGKWFENTENPYDRTSNFTYNFDKLSLEEMGKNPNLMFGFFKAVNEIIIKDYIVGIEAKNAARAKQNPPLEPLKPFPLMVPENTLFPSSKEHVTTPPLIHRKSYAKPGRRNKSQPPKHRPEGIFSANDIKGSNQILQYFTEWPKSEEFVEIYKKSLGADGKEAKSTIAPSASAGSSAPTDKSTLPIAGTETTVVPQLKSGVIPKNTRDAITRNLAAGLHPLYGTSLCNPPTQNQDIATTANREVSTTSNAPASVAINIDNPAAPIATANSGAPNDVSIQIGNTYITPRQSPSRTPPTPKSIRGNKDNSRCIVQ